MILPQCDIHIQELIAKKGTPKNIAEARGVTDWWTALSGFGQRLWEPIWGKNEARLSKTHMWQRAQAWHLNSQLGQFRAGFVQLKRTPYLVLTYYSVLKLGLFQFEANIYFTLLTTYLWQRNMLNKKEVFSSLW